METIILNDFFLDGRKSYETNQQIIQKGVNQFLYAACHALMDSAKKYRMTLKLEGISESE